MHEYRANGAPLNFHDAATRTLYRYMTSKALNAGQIWIFCKALLKASIMQALTSRSVQ